MISLLDWNNKTKRKSLKDQFNNDPQKVITEHPLWRKNIIPHHPLYKNYFIIFDQLFDTKTMEKNVEIAQNNRQWINKNIYSENKCWDSITLKGLNGLSQDFLTETQLGIGNDNKYAYTPAMQNCDYFKDLLDSLNTEIYLVRLLKLKGRGKIDFHTDESVFKSKGNIIRCHIPIITNEKVKFRLGYPLKAPASGYNIWKADLLDERYLEPGHVWYTNVNTLHGVINDSSEDRIHLVIDLRPTDDMLRRIHGLR
jgi:hypothetical protein